MEIADVIRTPRLLMRWPRREAPLGLFAHLHPDTAASIRVLEKCGLARQDVGQTCIRRFVLLGTVALACLLVVGVLSGCSGESATSSLPQSTPTPTEVPGRAMFEHGSSEAAKRLAAAAESQVGLTRSYDPAYINWTIQAATSPRIEACVRMSSYGPSGNWASIFRSRCTRICQHISRSIHALGD